MPNPYGNLAGFTDPEQEGWQERVLGKVEQSKGQKKARHERKSGMYLFFDDPFRRYLHRAAQQRDISITGYGRRAVGAFIAYDLGLSETEVMFHTAQPAHYAASSGGKLKMTHDDGTGHGLWIIDGLITPDSDPL